MIKEKIEEIWSRVMVRNGDLFPPIIKRVTGFEMNKTLQAQLNSNVGTTLLGIVSQVAWRFPPPHPNPTFIENIIYLENDFLLNMI